MSFTVLIGRELPLLICLLQGDFSSLCFVGILTFYALKCFRSEIRLGCIRILVFIKVIRTTNMYIWVLWKFGVLCLPIVFTTQVMLVLLFLFTCIPYIAHGHECISLGHEFGLHERFNYNHT